MRLWRQVPCFFCFKSSVALLLRRDWYTKREKLGNGGGARDNPAGRHQSTGVGPRARRLSKRQSGIVVMFYSNAEDAESFARTHDVDVVYTREKLLGTTGMELIKKILRFRPTAECHVLQNNEEIPFARFSEDDPAYLESGEENTVFPRREDHSVIGLLLNKIETKSFGRHFTMDSWKREEKTRL